MTQRHHELVENLEVLLAYDKQITCTKCGDCCGNCPALVGKLCSVHPAITGNSDERGVICGDSPVGLALRRPRHIACTEVVELLRKLGNTVEIERDPTTTIPFFVSVVKNS